MKRYKIPKEQKRPQLYKDKVEHWQVARPVWLQRPAVWVKQSRGFYPSLEIAKRYAAGGDLIRRFDSRYKLLEEIVVPQ